eukprot:Hpha_TRINITY_DN5472_c0_g1::TRINITY_DN5472_c0_g1_i1::g.192397::m.192397
MTLALRGPDVVTQIFGITVLGIVCAVPVLLYHIVLKSVSFHGVLEDEGSSGTIKRFFLGDKVWCTDPDELHTLFVERWGPAFDAFTSRRQWFVVFEAACTLAMSIAGAWQPDVGTACHVRNMMVSLAALALLLGLIYWRPFFAPFEFSVAVIIAGSTAVAAVLMSIALVVENGTTLGDLAAYILLVSTVVVFLKGLFDITTQVYDLYMGRRAAVRMRQRERVKNLFTQSPLVESKLEPVYAVNTPSLKLEPIHSEQSPFSNSFELLDASFVSDRRQSPTYSVTSLSPTSSIGCSMSLGGDRSLTDQGSKRRRKGRARNMDSQQGFKRPSRRSGLPDASLTSTATSLRNREISSLRGFV